MVVSGASKRGDVPATVQASLGYDRNRFVALDGARLLASFAIIWVHMPKSPALDASTALGRFAVPFFTQVAVLLAFAAPDRRPEVSSERYAAARFLRIYPVFVVWAIFYALTRLASHQAMHQPIYHVRAIDLFWNGTALQLWFLPFILVATILAFVMRKTIDYWDWDPSLVEVASGLIGTGCVYLPGMHSLASSLGYTGTLSLDAFPSVCWAIGLATACRSTSAKPVRKTTLIAALGATLLVGGTIWTWLAGRQIFAENLAGFGLTLVVLNPQIGTQLRCVARGGFLAFGVYLTHPFWVEGLETVEHRFRTGDSPVTIFITFVLASLLSAASAFILWRTRATRWLVV